MSCKEVVRPIVINSMKPFQPGQIVNAGRYQIIQEVNRGGTATVFEALDIFTQMKVALKVMDSTENHVALQIMLVKREVEYASHTCHSNIVRLLNVFEESSHLVLVWELIEGQDLLNLLNEIGGQMSEDMAAFYFHQILRGVAFMHEQTFCHRDLKLENCMVEKKTQVLKIIDFGLSKHLDSASTFGVGTPDYMSPEMFGIGQDSTRKKGPKYDAKAVDVWALGVSLYLMITGVYPFDDPDHPHSLSHTFRNIRKGVIRPFPDTVSSDCQTLIKTLLSLAPADRPSLNEIAGNHWLNKNAKIHASKIDKPELYIAPKATRVRFRDSVVDINMSLGVANGLDESKTKGSSMGCFRIARSSNKGRLSSFFRHLFHQK
eukprot:g6486.t1